VSVHSTLENFRTQKSADFIKTNTHVNRLLPSVGVLNLEGTTEIKSDRELNLLHSTYCRSFLYKKIKPHQSRNKACIFPRNALLHTSTFYCYIVKGKIVPVLN
jgi:hypothetical protein